MALVAMMKTRSLVSSVWYGAKGLRGHRPLCRPCISPLIRRTCPLVVRRPGRRTERLHRPVATCDEGLGRAVAGTLLTEDGAAIRVVASTATSDAFDQDARALAQERCLVQFLQD